MTTNGPFQVGDKIRLANLEQIFTVISIANAGNLFCRDETWPDVPDRFRLIGRDEFVFVSRVQTQDSTI